MNEWSLGRKIAAWGVHLYTAMGLPIAFLATVALFERDVRFFFLAECLAVFVDASDGTLARKVKVSEVLPSFSGRKLDDIVDFLTFVFLPALALPVLGMLPEGWSWFATIPMLASGYGFCQERAKTDESFIGFPSYWNIIVPYLYVLDATPWFTVALLALLSLLVFVPIHYVYPTKTRLLRPVTIGLGMIWALMMIAISWDIEAPWAKSLAWVSVAYPVYYTLVSAVNHRRITKAFE